MDTKRLLAWLFLIAVLPASLLAATDSRKGILKGHSATSFFNNSGEFVLIYQNADEGLSSALQDTASGEYSLKALSSSAGVLIPVIKMDRSGTLWLLGEEEKADNTVITLSRLERNEVIEKQIISPGKGRHFSPDLTFDQSNNPWVTWIAYSAETFSVFVKEVHSGKMWGINDSSSRGAFSPKIAADGDDRIWVVWTGNSDGRDEIFTRSFDRFQWTPEHKLNGTNPFPQILPDIGSDAEGRIWATWCAYDGKDYEIYCAFQEDRAWSQPERVTNNLASDAQPSISFILGNIPVFVWSQTKKNCSRICLRYKIEGTWSPEVEIYRSHKTSNSFPKVSTHGERLGIVWQSLDEIHSVLLSFPPYRDKIFTASELGIPMESEAAWPAENKYLAFGDSITFGMIDYLETPELGYIPRLESRLYQAYGPTQVVNEGWPGELTYQGLARIEDVLSTHNARYFLLMEGTNDVVFRHVSMDTTVFNLEQMIQICRDNLVFPVLATIIPRNDKRWVNDFFRERIFYLNDLIRDLADRIDVSFVDMFDIYYTWPESDGGWTSLLSNDYVHPSIKGYEVMAESWFGEIKRIPFPAINLRITRLIQQSLGTLQVGNHITWNHSPNLFELSDFRAYKIFRTEIEANPSTFKLIRTLNLKQPDALITGSIIFPDRNGYGQGCMDFDIDASDNYKYVLILVRKDGVVGPNSKIANDNAQGGTDN